MFKKFKDKLAEEMKQSPARLQASMQQLAQAVSPALSTNSIQDLAAASDNFSLTEETDTETPKNSPAKHGFQSVNLTASSVNSTGASRRSSISSVASEASFLFPMYESSGNTYHLQSDMDQSASEVDDNISPQLDRVTKDQLYIAYRKIQTKHRKYRDKYTELASHYREMERTKLKLESLLVETQDKALRRIADLKEQCQLEQQAKAHLEDMLRNDIEEKDCLINSLNTKIALLQKNSVTNENLENVENEISNDNQNTELLIDLSTDVQTQSDQTTALVEEVEQLKDTLAKFQNLVAKLKTSLKRTKENLAQEREEKSILERDYNAFKESNATRLKILEEELENANQTILTLKQEIDTLKKREEESVISLAENKLSIHRELEEKEIQIKQLQQELKQTTQVRENLNEMVERYKVEIEDLKSTKKNEETEMNNKYHEELNRNNDLLKKLSIDRETIEQLNEMFEENKSELIILKSKHDKLLQLFENEKSEKEQLQSDLDKFKEVFAEKDNVCKQLQSKVDECTTALAESNEKLQIYTNTANNDNKLRQELETLSAEHNACKTIVDDLKAKIQEVRSQVYQLVQEKENFANKMNEYKASFQQVKQKYKDLKKNIIWHFSEQQNEISIFANVLTQKLEIFCKLEKNNVKLRKEIDEMKVKVNTFQQLSADFTKAQDENCSLRKELKLQLEHIQEMKLKVNKYEELQSKNKKLISEIDEMNFKLFDLRKVSEDSTNLNELLRSKVAILEQSLYDKELLANQLEESKQKYNETLTYLQTLESKVAKDCNITEELNKYKENNMRLEHEFVAKDNELRNIQAQYNEQNELIANYEKECKVYLNKSNELEEKLATSNNIYNKLKKEFDELNATCQKDFVSQNQMIQDLTVQNNSKNETLKDMDNEIKQLKNNVDDLKHQIIILEKTNDDKVQEIEILESNKTIMMEELVNTKAQHKNLIQELEVLKATKDELFTENKTLKEKQNELMKENHDLEIMRCTLNNNISMFELKVQELESENKALNVRINELSAEQENMQILKNKIEELTKLNAEISVEKQALEDERNKFVTINEELNKSCQSLNNQIHNSSENWKKEINLLSEELRKKNEELHLLEENNIRFLENIDKLNNKNSLEVKEIDEINKVVEEKEKEIQTLIETSKKLNEELQSAKKRNELKEEDLAVRIIALQEEKQKLEIQLDETLVTFQAKESQMNIINDELKTQIEKLKNELIVDKEEQTLRLKQLAKEFQAQLHDKDEELQAALEKRFDQQQNYETDLIRQYKDQLKDFQEELTAKSEQIENIILDNKKTVGTKQEEINKLLMVIEQLKQEHMSEMREMERKWRTALEQKTVQLEAKHEQEINELTKEWQNERRSDKKSEVKPEELESTSRVAMAAVQSNTGSFHTLQQTLLSQKRELAELRKLVKLRHDTLEDSTEIEYLRNILFEYMMGKETLVLARVIAAVVKFDQEQTSKILKKEEDKLTLLGSLGLT